MSGSLWFPDFIKYCMSKKIKKVPKKIYFSLGDKESSVKNKMLKTVQTNTESLFEYYKNLGIDVTYELNQGNHFKDADIRSAKGIKKILEEK